MRRRHPILLVLALLSCATPYGAYQCKGLVPICSGYSEVRLAQDTYQVRFEGAGNDSRARIEDYTLLRSAELTLEKGFTRFVVLGAADRSSSQTGYSPGTYSPPTTSCSGKGKDKVCVTTPGQWSGGGSYTTTLPGYAYTIEFVAEDVNSGGAMVYDALSIQSDLRQKYDLAPAARVGAGPPR